MLQNRLYIEGGGEFCSEGFGDWVIIIDRINDTYPNPISVRVIELLEDNDPFQAMDIYDEIVKENGSSIWN